MSASRRSARAVWFQRRFTFTDVYVQASTNTEMRLLQNQEQRHSSVALSLAYIPDLETLELKSWHHYIQPQLANFQLQTHEGRNTLIWTKIKLTQVQYPFSKTTSEKRRIAGILFLRFREITLCRIKIAEPESSFKTRKTTLPSSGWWYIAPSLNLQHKTWALIYEKSSRQKWDN